jgi:hypothetical protein
MLYTYSLAASGIALVFNPRQELFPEGLPEGNSSCQGMKKRATPQSQPVSKYFIILISIHKLFINRKRNIINRVTFNRPTL